MVQRTFETDFFSEAYADAMVKIAIRLGWCPERLDDGDYLMTMPQEDIPLFDVLTDF